MIPCKCPVCEGKGIVPAGFYNISRYDSTSMSDEQCRSCNGTGIVWGIDETKTYITTPTFKADINIKE